MRRGSIGERIAPCVLKNRLRDGSKIIISRILQNERDVLSLAGDRAFEAQVRESPFRISLVPLSVSFTGTSIAEIMPTGPLPIGWLRTLTSAYLPPSPALLGISQFTTTSWEPPGSRWKEDGEAFKNGLAENGLLSNSGSTSRTAPSGMRPNPITLTVKFIGGSALPVLTDDAMSNMLARAY